MEDKIIKIKDGKYWKKYKNEERELWFEFTPEEILERALYLEDLLQKQFYALIDNIIKSC